MGTMLHDELKLAMETAGIGELAAVLAMHLAEIEDEAEKVLDLLAAARSHAHHAEKEGVQDALAELAVALEHLHHHLGAALPDLQRELEIGD